jgi:hypothetical protein
MGWSPAAELPTEYARQGNTDRFRAGSAVCTNDRTSVPEAIVPVALLVAGLFIDVIRRVRHYFGFARVNAPTQRTPDGWPPLA